MLSSCSCRRVLVYRVSRFLRVTRFLARSVWQLVSSPVYATCLVMIPQARGQRLQRLINVIQFVIIGRRASVLPIWEDRVHSNVSLFIFIAIVRLRDLNSGRLFWGDLHTKSQREICLSAYVGSTLRLQAGDVFKLYFLERNLNDAYKKANGLWWRASAKQWQGELCWKKFSKNLGDSLPWVNEYCCGDCRTARTKVCSNMSVGDLLQATRTVLASQRL